MRKITVEGGYPVWVEEIAKADTPWRDVDEIAAVLRTCIHHLAGSAFIGVFDHYGLNLRVGEALPIDMQDAKTILFCPDAALLNPATLALCPCAIGVAGMKNRFVISFMDTPNGAPIKILAQWIEGLHIPGTHRR